MITRRRFLSISACAAFASTLPARASGRTWRGHAFGSEVSITLSGERQRVDQALNAALDTIRRLEKLFSLYDPGSALSHLNRNGELTMPPEFAQLIEQCGDVHHLTDGLFDPTIQPLFAAMLRKGGVLSEGERIELQPLIGWRRVALEGAKIRFKTAGMALTLNGIAQGFATDRVTDVLAAHGFTNALVNIGEYRAGQNPADLTIQSAEKHPVASVSLRNAAIATTSSSGFRFTNGSGHVLEPKSRETAERWSTVSVLAPTATLADGLSTALILTQDDALCTSLYERKMIFAALLYQQNGEKNVIGEFG